MSLSNFSLTKSELINIHGSEDSIKMKLQAINNEVKDILEAGNAEEKPRIEIFINIVNINGNIETIKVPKNALIDRDQEIENGEDIKTLLIGLLYKIDRFVNKEDYIEFLKNYNSSIKLHSISMAVRLEVKIATSEISDKDKSEDFMYNQEEMESLLKEGKIAEFIKRLREYSENVVSEEKDIILLITSCSECTEYITICNEVVDNKNTFILIEDDYGEEEIKEAIIEVVNSKMKDFGGFYKNLDSGYNDCIKDLDYITKNFLIK